MITSIILGLHLLGFLSADHAADFLFVAGTLLIVSEFFITSGMVAFSGLLALYIGYTLKYGQSMMFGVHIDWSVLFGVAFIEFFILAALTIIVIRYRRKKVSTGVEAMVGAGASIVEWHGRAGRVRIKGETWRAESDKTLDLNPDDKVIVEAVKDLTVKIKI